MPEDERVKSSDDYIIYDNNDQNTRWIIALNQQSLHVNSPFMAHGGATLEEVLVPVVIAKKNIEESKNYKVRPVNLEVYGTQRDIEVKITPKPIDSKVILKAADGTDTTMVFNNDSKTWIGQLNRGIEQDIFVCIETQITTFRTVPKSRINNGGDGFDD